ncbi:MAG: winged helix-turn-helix domain-containing protein [Spirochaetota bacterium]
MLDALGAMRFDDYLAEPWTTEELRFRVRRLLPASSLRMGDATISWAPHWIRVAREGYGQKGVALPPDQYALFEVLARAAGEIVDRDVLLALSAHRSSGSRALDMRVARLRVRLQELTDGWPDSPDVRAVRGVGYRLGYAGPVRQQMP